MSPPQRVRSSKLEQAIYFLTPVVPATGFFLCLLTMGHFSPRAFMYITYLRGGVFLYTGPQQHFDSLERSGRWERIPIYEIPYNTRLEINERLDAKGIKRQTTGVNDAGRNCWAPNEPCGKACRPKGTCKQNKKETAEPTKKRKKRAAKPSISVEDVKAKIAEKKASKTKSPKSATSKPKSQKLGDILKENGIEREEYNAARDKAAKSEVAKLKRQLKKPGADTEGIQASIDKITGMTASAKTKAFGAKAIKGILAGRAKAEKPKATKPKAGTPKQESSRGTKEGSGESKEPKGEKRANTDKNGIDRAADTATKAGFTKKNTSLFNGNLMGDYVETDQGTEVFTMISEGSVEFTINDSYTAVDIPDPLAAGKLAIRECRKLLLSLPDGTVISNAPETDDDRAAARDRVFQKLGFGPKIYMDGPDGTDKEGQSLGIQRAIVYQGKLYPVDKEFYDNHLVGQTNAYGQKLPKVD